MIGLWHHDWYQYEPGGEAWVLTEARSRKARLIEAAGRFTLMVERDTPTVRYVSVEGAEFGEQVAIYLRPQRWLSSDLGPGRARGDS